RARRAGRSRRNPTTSPARCFPPRCGSLQKTVPPVPRLHACRNQAPRRDVPPFLLLSEPPYALSSFLHLALRSCSSEPSTLSMVAFTSSSVRVREECCKVKPIARLLLSGSMPLP